MKKYSLIIFLGLLSYITSYGQKQAQDILLSKDDNIKSDSINKSPNSDFEKKIGLKPIDRTENTTEIRFYEYRQLSGTRNLKIIACDDSTWTATEYDEWNKPVKINKYVLPIPEGQIRAIVRVLLNSNLAYLPDQEELEPKMKKYHMVNGRKAEQKLMVSDGESYTVEFKIRNSFRVYGFLDPDVYSGFYTDVQELKDYVAIVDIFNNMVKRK
jgi:hypothetical protein